MQLQDNISFTVECFMARMAVLLVPVYVLGFPLDYCLLTAIFTIFSTVVSFHSLSCSSHRVSSVMPL